MERNMEINIAGHKVGEGNPTFIIAEIGMNHNGNMELAKEMIQEAAKCGCDAAKFQIFTADKLVTKNARTYGNEKGHLPDFQQEMYRKHELTKEQYVQLKEYCDEMGLVFFGSVWDEDNADLLEDVGGACYKVGSVDITHLPMLKHIANKGKPIILSTGMATLQEIEEAVEVIKEAGNEQMVLLHCISGYPTKIEDSNLRFIETLRKSFPYPIGFSDHTPGSFSSVGAVTLGAKVIEKHFTTDKGLPGVDHHLSMDIKEMTKMVEQIRLMEKARGSGEHVLTDAEQETIKMARRSVVARRKISAGSVITKDMLVIKRPGTGMKPKEILRVIGMVADRDIKEDTVLQEEMLR
jgi:N,N'-diacetyllegionaminate synthase